MSDAQSESLSTTPLTEDEFECLLDIVSGISEDARRKVQALRDGREEPEGVKDETGAPAPAVMQTEGSEQASE